MAWKPQYVLNSEKSSWDPKLNSAHPSPQCAHRRVGMPEAWRKIKPNMECKDEWRYAQTANVSRVVVSGQRGVGSARDQEILSEAGDAWAAF